MKTGKKLSARLVAFALALASVCSMFVVSPSKAQAATTTKGYTIGSGNTQVYSDTKLTKKYGTIYGSDELTFNQVTSKYCKVTYPVTGTNKTKTGYISTSSVLTKTSGNAWKAGWKVTTYRRNSTANSYGYIAKGDNVTKLGTKGNFTQVKYPVSGGWKYAFVKTDDLTKNSGIVSQGEIDAAAEEYGIGTSTNAYKALLSINSKYSSNSNVNKYKSGTLVFLFEGVGNSSRTDYRSNAMCVVIKNGSIDYISKYCSTIPDHPFEPKYNDGTPMPTLKSGVFFFTTKNHAGKYAALNVRGIKSSSDAAPVLRYSSNKKRGSNSTSSAINVHYRGSTAVSNSNPPSSQGCQNILKSKYLGFCKGVGILKSSRNSITKYDNYVTGKIIIDRSYAKNYLTRVGYPEKDLNDLM